MMIIHRARLLAAYPELVARRYNAPPERVAISVVEILGRWGWRIVDSRNLPKTESEQS